MSMFARIPRGKQVSNAPKSGQMKIDRKFVQSFEQAVLDQGLQTIMLNTSSTINLTVGATGGNAISLTRNGEVVADKADMQKILNIDSFIVSERKQVQKEATSANLEASLSAIVEMSKEPSMGPPVTKLPNGYLDVYRGISAQMKTLAENTKAIEALEVTGEANELVKNYLLAQSARIRAAAGNFIRYRAATNEDEPDKLNRFLKAEKVLNWVFLRLTQQKLSVNAAGFQIKNLLFPKDPSKGLAVSMYELMTDEIRNNQGGILSGMTVATSVLKNENFVRRFCNIANDVPILDFENNDVAKSMMNVPIMVVPPYIAVSDVVDILAKQGLRGFAWNVGNTLTPQDNLKFLGTLFKRVHYLSLTRANNKIDLLQELIPGFEYSHEALSKDVYVQLKTFAKDHADVLVTLLGTLNSKSNSSLGERVVLFRLLTDVLQISPGDQTALGTVAHALRLIMTNGRFPPGQTPEAFTEIPFGNIGLVNDTWSSIIGRRDMRTDREANKALLRTVMDKLPGGNSKKNTADRRNRIGAVRSTLGTTALGTLAVLKQRRFDALAQVLEQWFRSFLNLDIQGAVANLILAKLEWHLSQPISSTRNERMAFIDVHEFDNFAGALQGEANDSPQEEEEESEVEDDAGAAD